MKLAVYTGAPKSPIHPTPLLFVHGAWQGAWCWQKYWFDFFCSHGYTVHALDLRGHGNSPERKHLRWARISDYVNDVAEVAAMLPTSPIIIGHSMGGLVVQKYLEAHPAPAAVLVTSVPPQGALPAALRYAYKHPRAFLKANLTLSLYPFVYPPALGRAFLFSPEFSQSEYAELAPGIQDESYCAFLDMMFFRFSHPSRIKTPVLVLGAAHDEIFTLDEVKATARAYGTMATIFPHSGHELMLDHDWRDAADKIVQWLDERSL